MGRGPLTGGQLNPIVTLSTIVTGLTPPLRGLAYIAAQMVGASLAGVLLAVSLGTRASGVEHYGCYFNPSPAFNSFNASVFEYMGTLFYVSMMYGQLVHAVDYQGRSFLTKTFRIVIL